MNGLLFIFSFWASATSFIVKPFPNTVSQTSTIVRGTAGSSYSDYEYAPNGTQQIITKTEFRVEETLKGDLAPGVITLKALGGEKDGKTLEIPGQVKFESGKEVVVFLKTQDTDDAWVVSGMMMGKYAVEEKNGEKWISGPGLSSLTHPHVQNFDSHGHPDTSTEKKKWSLQDLRDLIQRQSQGEKPENPSESKMLVKTSDEHDPSASSLHSQESNPPKEGGDKNQGSPSLKTRFLILALGGLLGLILYWMRRRRSP